MFDQPQLRLKELEDGKTEQMPSTEQLKLHTRLNKMLTRLPENRLLGEAILYAPGTGLYTLLRLQPD